ncbi:MAG: hypothetical protein RL287_248 [Actinomycetota bacterium]
MPLCDGGGSNSPFRYPTIKGETMRPLGSHRVKKFSIYSSLIFALLISSTFTSRATTGDSEERFRVDMKLEDGWHGVNFDNTGKDWGLPSHIYAKPNQNSGSGQLNFASAVCKSLEDSECLKPGLNLIIRALFDKCESETDLDCIVSFAATKPDGTKLIGELKEVLASRHSFSGDKKQGIPDGSGATIWTIKDGATSLDYALVAGVELSVNGAAESRAAGNDSRVKRFDMKFALQPVEMVNSSEYKEVVMAVEGGILTGYSSSLEQGCFVAAEGRCALTKAFDTSLNFEMTVRLSKGVPGWMVGRVNNFKLGTKILPAQNGFEMTLSGNASKVGAVITWSKWKDTTAEIRSLYEQGVDGRRWRPGKPASELLIKDGESRTILTYLNEAGERSIKHFNAWLPLISDKASAMRTRWNLQSVEDQSGQYSQCSAGKGLVGVINSNASVYSDGPPTFNKTTGSLEYKVAAPHYTSDGTTKHLGSYDLTMRSDVARCLYGFSDAPISATVSIESDGGTNVISTESVSEKDGLIRLRAAGFTFSSPTIKVKLSQQSTGSSSTVAPKVSKKTITCVKGATKKKVTATNPKCPKGFKKA